jgi:hypothetical protein
MQLGQDTIDYTQAFGLDTGTPADQSPIDYSQAFGLDVGAAMPAEAPTVSAGPTDWTEIFSGINDLLKTGAGVALTQEQLQAQAAAAAHPATVIAAPTSGMGSLFTMKNGLIVGGALLAGFAVMSLLSHKG